MTTRFIDNRVYICIDSFNSGGVVGTFYHSYHKEGVIFTSLEQLIVDLERIFDISNYPEASTIARSFRSDVATGTRNRNEAADLTSFKHSPSPGKIGTFVLSVQYRQNATWQGEVFWEEQGKTCKFLSELEFIKLIEDALEKAEKQQTTCCLWSTCDD